MTITPVRIQRSRRKGSKLPPNTVCVPRGTKFGNPFKGPGAAQMFKLMMRGRWTEIERRLAKHGPSEVGLVFALMGLQMTRHKIRSAIGELRGKNLCCWCKPGADCHGDTLLAMANREEPA
jgi:uncharacterized protein DUF4326